VFDRAETIRDRPPYPIRPATRPVRTIPVGTSESPRPESTPDVERRRHWRASPPSVLNGAAYTLRSVRFCAPLLLTDLAAVFASVVVASALVGAWLPEASFSAFRLLAVLALGLVAARAVLGLYPAIGMSAFDELTRSTRATFLVVAGLLLAGLLYGADAASQWTILTAGAVFAVATPVLRSLTRHVFSQFSWWRQPILVFETGPGARHVCEHFEKHPDLGLEPVLVRHDLHDNGAFHSHSQIGHLAAKHRAVCAAVPLNGASGPRTEALLRECANTFPHLLVVPDMKGMLTTSAAVANLGGLVGVRGGKNLLKPAPRVAKRLVDAALALLITLLCLPICVVIALAVKLTSRGPIFYGQQRVGQDRRPFLAWKFRTMRPNADEILAEYLATNPELREEWEKDHKLKDDPRVTTVGRFLRRTSLDELPQLWNILSGEMSLVGPRPIVEAEAEKYGPDFGRYLSVPPGLTGLWQVSGRNRTTYEERIRLDAHYVENWSLMFDTYILARTVKAVLTGDGAY
jgi:Undecaprenyl-phosphate galactose phosphotransferase WbaP